MKKAIAAGIVALLAMGIPAPQTHGQTPAAQGADAAKSNILTIPAGQRFILRLQTSLHTNGTRKGDKVEYRTAADVVVEHRVAIPMRSLVRATVTKSKRAGRLFGRAEIQLRLDEIMLPDGSSFPLKATITRAGLDPLDATKDGQPRIKGESGAGGNTGAVVNGGVQGAIIGAVSAGGKGALYGSAAGAGIALAGMILRRGPDIDLPRDTLFEARIDKPLDVPLAAAQRAERVAQREAPPPQLRASENDGLRSRPVLRRSPRVEDQPPEPEKPAGSIAAGTEAPVEKPTFPEPEPIPPVTPPVRSASVHREAPPGDPGVYKLSVKVGMVVVDAVVRDKAGRIIENLKKDDFRVYEDGVEQPIRSFSRDELPIAVALVIDRSGSVAPYINELRRIAYHALQQLKPRDEVALFSFAANAERIEDLTTDRQRIADSIERIRAGGGTNIIDALSDANSYLAGVAPEERRAIILVSDNQATVWPRTSEGELIRAALEDETVIYSLKTSGDRIPLTMRLPRVMMEAGNVGKVTRETGGEVIDVRRVDMLDAALGAVVERLRMRYALGYYPPPEGRGAFHSLEVRLVDTKGKPGHDYFIHARRGYYSTGDQPAHPARP